MKPARSNFQANRQANSQTGRRVRLAKLRRLVERIERGAGGAGKTTADTCFALSSSLAPASPADVTAGGTARFDPLFAGGGGGPALQELLADGYGSQPAVRDVGLALAASLMHRSHADGCADSSANPKNMVLWCQRQRDMLEFGNPYGPGLQTLGFPPDRLLMVTGRRDADCLWAMEQGLASRSLLAVIGAVDRIDLTASRRLSLAARAHGIWCLLLPLQHGREPSAARTRWRIKAAPSVPDALDSKGLGPPCWQLSLERSENGSTGRWIVEWDHAAHHFHLAAPMADRPVTRRDGPDGQAGDVVTFDRTG